MAPKWAFPLRAGPLSPGFRVARRSHTFSMLAPRALNPAQIGPAIVKIAWTHYTSF